MQVLFMFILIGGFLGTKDPSKFDSKFLIKCIYNLYTFSLRASNLFTLRNSKVPGLGTVPQNHRILALAKNNSIQEMFGLLKIVTLFFCW